MSGLTEGHVSKTPYYGMAGISIPISNVHYSIASLGCSHLPVLITGETGVGKELVARAIHAVSGKNPHRFIDFNCAYTDSTSIHNELFGHAKGSFTGASTDAPGKIEIANDGTLFLDEVGDMPLFLQASILRALSVGRVWRYGGTEPKDVDFRLISATNKDLKDRMDRGQFRSDLYHRLNGSTIYVPALRERKDDIPYLLAHFLQEYALQEKKVVGISKGGLDILMDYNWPGNVRELEHVARNAIAFNGEPLTQSHNESKADLRKRIASLILSEAVPRISPDDIQALFARMGIKYRNSAAYAMNIGIEEYARGALTLIQANGAGHFDVVYGIERALLIEALRATGGNKREAAKILKLPRTTFIDKARKLNVDVPRTETDNYIEAEKEAI